MKFVDTNILIRLITDDIPTLRQQAEKMVTAHGSGQLIILDAILAEVFFVLEKGRYKFNREQVCQKLSDLLLSTQFAISTEAEAAIKAAAENQRLDFADCLLVAHAGFQKINLLTFDKDLLAAAK